MPGAARDNMIFDQSNFEYIFRFYLLRSSPSHTASATGKRTILIYKLQPWPTQNAIETHTQGHAACYFLLQYGCSSEFVGHEDLERLRDVLLIPRGRSHGRVRNGASHVACPGIQKRFHGHLRHIRS